MTRVERTPGAPQGAAPLVPGPQTPVASYNRALTFYLGTHHPHWLAQTDMPLFISHRRLAARKRLYRPRGWWALDSGGFSELSLYGMWKTSPESYVSAVVRYDTEIGNLGWAAPQDWMCEPVITAKTGLTVLDHQRRTVANFVYLQELWDHVSEADCPFMPVLQGWELADYRRCWDLYGEAGVNLSEYELVGLGSVCRRQATEEIGDIIAMLLDLDPGLPIHGFGVKKTGLARYGHLLASADSMAWSFNARRSEPLDGCTTHINCANCLAYATRWYEQVIAA